jgi:hypothetical protein
MREKTTMLLPYDLLLSRKSRNFDTPDFLPDFGSNQHTEMSN